MELSKNDNIELNIDALTSEGSGVGRYNGLAVFVRGTAPGDKIEAHIIKRSKNYAVGIVNKIISSGASRIESDCPYSKRCGGCSFRHISYDEELKYKKNRVQEALTRIGGIDVKVDEIIAADSVNGYRNKAQYPVSVSDSKMLAGFYAYKSHRIIPCVDCRLQPVEFEAVLNGFSKWVEECNISSYDENTGNGYLRHIYIRKAFETGELMACAVVNSNSVRHADTLVRYLTEIKGMAGICFNFNTENSNVVLGNKTVTVWGRDYICDILLGKKFVISPHSFYQVNHSQCERLYAKAAELAELKGGEVMLDLYCGVGTIGLTMADRVKKLIGIEIVPEAIENARLNAKLNDIDNAEFICADAPKGAEILKKQGINPNVIILDPPRKGCGKELFDTVEQMSPEKIVYISCDPATLARDLAILKEKNYIAQRVTAVDMFPRTPHVETVCLLSRKEFRR